MFSHCATQSAVKPNSPARNGTQFDSLLRTAKREDMQGTTSIAAAIYVVSSFGNASCRRINSSPSRFRSSHQDRSRPATLLLGWPSARSEREGQDSGQKDKDAYLAISLTAG
jgi:hypothetical protein